MGVYETPTKGNIMPNFNWNANPEHIATRAAELSLEQHDRLDSHLKKNRPATDFYSQPFETHISNQIASLMGAYAVLKGYVSPERARIDTPRPS
jgi:hypothetical protein